MKIFVVTPSNSEDRAFLFEGLGRRFEVVFKQDLGENEGFEAFCEADILMGNAPVSWLEQKSDHLTWWQLESAGFDKYKGVKTNAITTNVGDYYAQPCAETIVGGVLALYRKVDTFALLQKECKWVGEPLRLEMKLLQGQKVVILGAGTIGNCVKQILSGFDCETTVMARSNPDADIHTKDELKQLLPSCDLVISCLPGTAKGFFTKEMLGLMPVTSVFANVGRGNTVDEEALIESLRNGEIEGAVLDVTDMEPLPTASPLWSLPNVLLTQHTGGGRRKEHQGKFKIFLENLALFERGKSLKNLIDLGRGY